jgi:hypothetical protein
MGFLPMENLLMDLPAKNKPLFCAAGKTKAALG